MNGARGFLTFKEKLRDKAAKVMREAVLSFVTAIGSATPQLPYGGSMTPELQNHSRFRLTASRSC